MRHSRRYDASCRERRERDRHDLPSRPANRGSDRDDQPNKRERVGEPGEETGDVRGERICDERHDAPSLHPVAFKPPIILWHVTSFGIGVRLQFDDNWGQTRNSGESDWSLTRDSPQRIAEDTD